MKKDRAASSMAKRLADSLSPARRSEIASLGASARWACKTPQDKRICLGIQNRMECVILEAVDTLFDWFKTRSQPRTLVIHQGSAWIADPTTLDYRVFSQKHPEAIVGTYDRNATKEQVFGDLYEIDACARILKKVP